MPEPTTSTVVAVSLTAGGLAVFGVATGLHPMLLLCGMAGGWWATFYQAPMPLRRRLAALVISSLSAAWITPPVVAATVSLGWLGPQATGEILQFPGALFVGLLAFSVIGPGMLKLAARKMESA